MEKTGEGTHPTRPFVEIRSDRSVVGRLRDEERRASAKSFRERIGGVRGKLGDPEYMENRRVAVYAARLAVHEIGMLLGLDTADDDMRVLNEIIKLKIRINLGTGIFFSISAREENDEREIKLWEGIHQDRVPPVITVKMGSKEFKVRGDFENWGQHFVGKTLDENVLPNYEESDKGDVWAAGEFLSTLSQKVIVREFREQIEAGQNAASKSQKLGPKEELRALRRGE